MDHVHEKLSDIQQAIRYCAKLDCLMALATFSNNNNLTKPEMVTNEKVLKIHGGRHILLDLQKKFVANDTSVDVMDKNLINIIIAPNASGKSVYIKEIAQITYLAHVGSYVPAIQAKISVVDAIYTRIYTSESMFLDKSSFLVEVQQMSNVIMNSSTHSLVLVDEMGQGTNENDGKSLLIACLEHLTQREDLSPIAFVITHYVDIYEILKDTEWITMKTFKMDKLADGSIQSTFKLIEGKCADQYAKNCSFLQQLMNQTVTTKSNSDNQE